jgi:RNA polymerase sigma-70 factor (ECF subfamily)
LIDFSGLYRAHAPDLHRFAFYLSGDRALAEDLVSETFIRLWNARARVELPTVKAYLFTITRNLYLQHLRAARRVARASLVEQLEDQRPSPAREAQARSELEATLADLQSLPEIDRAALLLRSVEQLSYEEIAATLGVSTTAARVKVHRARLKLQEKRR